MVANPYSAGGLQEVDGHLIRKNRRVTFIECVKFRARSQLTTTRQRQRRASSLTPVAQLFKILTDTVPIRRLFYDLFLVAALNLFTRESNLTNGANISSYIVYFAVLWSIWVGQAFYDVRFGASDGTSWIYGFVQLLTYAVSTLLQRAVLARLAC